ncbi:MAG: glutamate formimidoyltransferase, partial [Prevotella sp.]|nr:glutamate formimidoyltransferase [Prevotella sp.]
FRGAKTASKLIDMSRHHGTHPRIGATDVLPFVPVRGITLEECAQMARQLGRRMADELGIPVYLYEAAALRPEFRNLAVCRAGEYEAIAEKLADPARRPDLMPSGVSCHERSGCSVVGARDFLIAVNFNLATTSVETATAIARQVRERGYQGRPGTLKCVKAIGWYIPEYGFAQVSCNLTNFHVTSLRQLFDEVSRVALLQGTRVTGTEIIGLVPEEALFPDAVSYLGLDQLRPFRLEEKVLEYVLNR